MIEKIRGTLKGIDKDICQDKDGWWETSTGAEFGAKKLKEIEELVKNCSIPDVSQQRELFDAILDFTEDLPMCSEDYNRDTLYKRYIAENCA